MLTRINVNEYIEIRVWKPPTVQLEELARCSLESKKNSEVKIKKINSNLNF